MRLFVSERFTEFDKNTAAQKAAEYADAAGARHMEKRIPLPHGARESFWYARRDLNPRPLAPEANTLSS